MEDRSVVNPLTYIVNRQYDGKVEGIRANLFRGRLSVARNLYRKDLLAHYGCVNAIEFSSEGELLISGGDDRRVLLWSVAEAIHDMGNPVVMNTNHFSNIFCLAFDSTNSRIFSGGNDDQVIVHDIRSGQLVTKLSHKKPVYGLSVNPHNDHVLATAGDDGRILIYDIRESDPFCLSKYKMGFHSVMYNPMNDYLLVTANSEEGIALWDTRKPKECYIHYDKDAGEISGISACFDSLGRRVLALRRRLPPVLYDTHSRNAVCQFYHPQYYNSCTMKTCCFAGEDDEYVLSGSDDFNLYMWKIPKDNEWGQSHVVLRGHRSIVNQVRYNRRNNLIASSGVEKMIKLWSTLHIGMWSGSLDKDHIENQRSVYSQDDYIYLVGHSGQRISHDYSDHSTREDSRMMAFFDSLIQREIEGWDTQSEATFSSDSDSDADRIRMSWQSLTRCRKSAEDVCKKYKPNRIAQLIAQKRNRLAKMAHRKSTAIIKRNSTREKPKKRKNSRKSKSKHGKSFSKKCGPGKRHRTSSPSTYTSEKENHGGGGGGSSSSSKHKSERSKYKKYRTRQSTREFESQSMDVPSTSTGITASNNNPMFRVIEQDSDEEGPSNGCTTEVRSSQENLMNILPTPLNGTQDMYVSVLEVSNGNSSNVVALRNNNQEFASTSTSSSAVGVLHHGNAYETYVSSLSDSDYDLVTPRKQHRHQQTEVDSGFATGPCSSSGGSRQRATAALPKNQCDSSDEYEYEKFRKRVKKARLNMRKQIGVDSDSN